MCNAFFPVDPDFVSVQIDGEFMVASFSDHHRIARLTRDPYSIDLFGPSCLDLSGPDSEFLGTCIRCAQDNGFAAFRSSKGLLIECTRSDYL